LEIKTKKSIIKNLTFTLIASVIFTVSLWAQKPDVQENQTSHPLKDTNTTISSQNTIDLSGQ
jgi:hypothetical protein